MAEVCPGYGDLCPRRAADRLRRTEVPVGLCRRIRTLAPDAQDQRIRRLAERREGEKDLDRFCFHAG